MSMDFAYSFPAMCGIQAGREYFVIMCPLKVLPKLFIFNDSELSSELRSNRTLNKNRLPEICDYILTNRKEYVFSSLTASIDGKYEFTPFTNKQNPSIGTLHIAMDSKLLINDGQHRKAAIEEAIACDSTLGDETISVVLFIDEGLKRSQQIFSDLNKHAVIVSKSISITYDHRDPISILTKEMIFNNPDLHQFTDLENSTLAKFSNKLFTISNFYKANQYLLNELNYTLHQKELNLYIKNFWEYLIDHLSEWQMVFTKQISCYVMRSDYIVSFGTVLESFGIIGNYLYINQIPLEKGFEKLNTINWSRNNYTDWQYRILGTGGRILRNTKATKLTCIRIKQLLNIALTKEEETLELQFMEEHNE